MPCQSGSDPSVPPDLLPQVTEGNSPASHCATVKIAKALSPSPRTIILHKFCFQVLILLGLHLFLSLQF